MSLSAFKGQQTSRQTSPFKRSRHQQLLQSPDMMRIRRRPDNDRRVPNDKRRPSKLAPPMRVLFTSEGAKERRSEGANERTTRATERPTNTMNDDDDETQRRLTYDRLRYQFQRTTTDCDTNKLRHRLFSRNYERQISNAATCFTHLCMVNNPTTWPCIIVGRAPRFGNSTRWAVDSDTFFCLSCRQLALTDAYDVAFG
ncbi:hypothetical protein Focb16_v004748 [Fusarium oxysporum f. sp. cubense]|uniref:Uncharacterized protein n=1 Tax=Fusarium oxysporum f. sp. cubense TaxID=61366 RepID=A0A559LLK2_FUSOC|nr:hypothetical protein Focb16_v004748 [Fusarium oxysporum f. sp. cubense]